MLNQSNPLALVSMALLTAVFCYECRAVLLDGLHRLLNALYYLIPIMLCLLAFVGVGLFLRWLGWRWLLIGLGRMMGAGFILTALHVGWIELQRWYARTRPYRAARP